MQKTKKQMKEKQKEKEGKILQQNKVLLDYNSTYKVYIHESILI